MTDEYSREAENFVSLIKEREDKPIDSISDNLMFDLTSHTK